MRFFPVSGGARISNDYAAPRSGGRAHEGNDLFAAETTPLLAVVDGNVRFGTDPLGGNIANLRTADGTRYYYAHLYAFQGANRPVRAGEVIGYLGKTGNAATTAPHLHFEIHPGGGASIDPYPALASASVISAGEASGDDDHFLRNVAIAALVGVAVWYIAEETDFGRELVEKYA